MRNGVLQAITNEPSLLSLTSNNHKPSERHTPIYGVNSICNGVIYDRFIKHILAWFVLDLSK